MLSSSLLFSRAFFDLGDRFYSAITPSPLKQPYWIHINQSLGQQLGIKGNQWESPELLAIFNGSQPFCQEPQIAMVYAGHQFGGYSPQLGDGRAILIAQIETAEGLRDIQLKGAGKTPYSRFGDGRAVLRSTIREYLASEAMYALGIPTTRSLCLLGSHEPVLREQLETGAMLTRVAGNHIRFGHFEYFFYTDQYDALKILADHVIDHYFPQAPDNNRYAYLLQQVVSRTASLIAQWQAIGFAHGVMNTDNMSILGETLDYGPYGFMDDYQPGFICNHSDHTGRYAFDEQPSIGLWNLNALAHALSPLIEHDMIVGSLQSYERTLIDSYAQLMCQKLGLTTQEKTDQQLVSQLLSLMAEDKVDYTYCFRQLCDFREGEAPSSLIELFTNQEAFSQWCHDYQQRLEKEKSDPITRQQSMKQVNPKFIPRNYLLQRAINRAQSNDFSEIETLFTLFQTPFDEHPQLEHYAQPTPAWGKHISVSCSS